MGEVASRALGVARHRAYRLLGARQQMPLSMIINALCEEVERRRTVDLEHACIVMHDAYEKAAVKTGWETQARSRVPWEQVPVENKDTMRAAVAALLHELGVQGR